jgi:hypothetical protein
MATLHKMKLECCFTLCNFFLQATTVVVTGLGLAAVGFVGRYVLRAVPGMSQKVGETMKLLTKFDSTVRKKELAPPLKRCF